MTDYRKIPGPGDEATWGPCTNHPLDPRTPDAREIEYEVIIPITANIVITVTADNKLEAIAEAISEYTKLDIQDIDWKTDEIEVEEL